MIVLKIGQLLSQFLIGHGYDPRMIGLKNATGAVEQSAIAVTELANSAKQELSGLSAQLRQGAQLAPIIVIGSAIVAVIALVVSLVAVARRD